MLFRNSIIFLLFCFLFFSCKKKIKPGVYVNEILCSNNSDIVDPLSHKQVDCIELFNGFDSPVDISGYYLTDNYNKPSKWEIPKKTILAPYEYFLIWADKLDTLNHTNFKLNSSGGSLLLLSKEKKIIDEVNYFEQSINVSYGRVHNANKNWAYYDEPTMGNSNNNKVATRNLIHSTNPIFSIDGGMYKNKQTIELSSGTERSEIRYTLNGNRPNRNSLLYKTPIKINKTTVIRAITIEEDKLISEILTNTYFIKLSKKGPIISIVADENTFWNSENGIYHNSLQRIKRLANLEFFENEKQVINQKVDMKISGNIAKYFDQKAIVLEANDKYGEPTLKHQFFPDNRLNEYPSILLRAGGHPDKYSSMFRDGFALKLQDNYINIDHPNYRPAIVYLNGKYWGMYNIREKTNSSFISNNHNLATNKFDYLQNCWLDINNGDDKNFRKIHDFIKQCDKSNPLNYNYVSQLIDIDNYIDYNIAEIFGANIDWPGWNIKFWKEKKEGAKWKWVLVDMDYSFGSGAKWDFNMIEYATAPTHTSSKKANMSLATVLLRKMLQFDDFEEKFIQRFAASLNIIYKTDRVLNVIEDFKSQRKYEMPNHIERWKESFFISPWDTTFKFVIPPTMELWDHEIDVIREFAKKRPKTVRTNLMKKFDLEELVNIQINSNGGNVKINSIPINNINHKGDYFKNLPIILNPTPDPGKKFLYWIINDERIESLQLEFSPQKDTKIIAVFRDNKHTKIPCLISANTILSKNKSPYYATCDIVVEKGAELIIQKGVQIFMGKHCSIEIHGGLKCNGSESQPILISPNSSSGVNEWGAICIDNATSKIELNYTSLIQATWHNNKSKYKASITALKSDVSLNHINIKSSFFPFYSEEGTISIKNSQMSSPKTCDFINVTNTENALVENCTILGNDYPDTDGIDYDEVKNGIIRGNTIYGFRGSNSDAIDVGERSNNILIEKNLIMNISDKGISVGQGSSVNINNNVIYGCEMGVAIKDRSSIAEIDYNTFYANQYGVAVYEKNPRAGGGRANISNCIFSQIEKDAVYVDSLSKATVQNSISDSLKLKGNGNIIGNPQFINEENFDLKLSAQSPARIKTEGSYKELGASLTISRKREIPKIVINEIYGSNSISDGFVQWVELYNNSSMDINLSGWTLRNEKHLHYSFPEKFILKAKYYVVIANKDSKFSKSFPRVHNYRSGLENELLLSGKKLLLYDGQMNLIDLVEYKKMTNWPENFMQFGISIGLKSPNLENNNEKNWITSYLNQGSPGHINSSISIDEMALRDQRVEKFIKEIKYSPEWLNTLKKKAKEKGLSLEEEIRNNADYMVFSQDEKIKIEKENRIF